jgi:hypothetical protein
VIHTRGESFDARDGAAAIAVEPGSAVVTIPDAHFLFTADFHRKGPDLVLTGEDGRKILVPDYFRQEKQPDLVSPEGAILSANVIELLAGTAAPGQYAQAGATAAQQPIGRVETVAGSASVVRNGVAVELNVGDLVFQGDVVETRSDATLAIAFSDGSAFTLQENARMALNEFITTPTAHRTRRRAGDRGGPGRAQPWASVYCHRPRSLRRSRVERAAHRRVSVRAEILAQGSERGGNPHAGRTRSPGKETGDAQRAHSARLDLEQYTEDCWRARRRPATIA